MAEQVKQEQAKEAPWLVKVSPEAFLDGAPGAIQSNSGVLDTTATGAKRVNARLAVVSSGIEVRWDASRPVPGKEPTTTPRRRVFPWPQVKWYDMPTGEAQSSAQNSGK